MNHLRGSIKKLVSSGVIKATYSLPSNTAECQAKVAELQKSMDYIYPLVHLQAFLFDRWLTSGNDVCA